MSPTWRPMTASRGTGGMRWSRRQSGPSWRSSYSSPVATVLAVRYRAVNGHRQPRRRRCSVRRGSRSTGGLGCGRCAMRFAQWSVSGPRLAGRSSMLPPEGLLFVAFVDFTQRL